MMSKYRLWRYVVLLVIGLMVPTQAQAGPFFGEWSWCWHAGRECPHGQYSPLHYWMPEFYEIRACVCPSNLDQFLVGPLPQMPPGYETMPYRCQSTPATGSSPYANPAAYYGRAVVRQ